MSKKRISFTIFFVLIALFCFSCSMWQIQRYFYKKNLVIKVENTDFNQSNYPKINLSGMQEFEIGNCTAKIISEKIAQLGWYSNKVWQKEILVLADIEGKKIIVSLGSVDTKANLEDDFQNHKNLENIKANIAKLPTIEGNFIKFQPKKRWFANDIMEDDGGYFPSNIMGIGSFSTFRKDYFERYWETKIDFPFALIDINPDEQYFEKSTLLPEKIKIKTTNHIFYVITWVFYGMISLCYLILNYKRL